MKPIKIISNRAVNNLARNALLRRATEYYISTTVNEQYEFDRGVWVSKEGDILQRSNEGILYINVDRNSEIVVDICYRYSGE